MSVKCYCKSLTVNQCQLNVKPLKSTCFSVLFSPFWMGLRRVWCASCLHQSGARLQTSGVLPRFRMKNRRTWGKNMDIHRKTIRFVWEKHGNSQENHELFDGFWWMCLWLPKSWGVPQWSSIYRWVFHDKPSINEDSPIYGNPHAGLSENGGNWQFIFDLPSKNGE